MCVYFKNNVCILKVLDCLGYSCCSCRFIFGNFSFHRIEFIWTDVYVDKICMDVYKSKMVYWYNKRCLINNVLHFFFWMQWEYIYNLYSCPNSLCILWGILWKCIWNFIELNKMSFIWVIELKQCSDILLYIIFLYFL